MSGELIKTEDGFSLVFKETGSRCVEYAPDPNAPLPDVVIPRIPPPPPPGGGGSGTRATDPSCVFVCNFGNSVWCQASPCPTFDGYSGVELPPGTFLH